MKKISEKIIVDNGYRKCLEKTFEFDTGGKGHFLALENSRGIDGIFCIGITQEGKFLLVDEYRVGPEKIVRSCVQGSIDDPFGPENTAKKELLEETGYISQKMIPIMQVITNPYYTGKMYGYLALDCRKSQEQKLLTQEEIRQIELSQEELENQILGGIIDCAFLIALYFTAKEKTKNFTKFNS